MSPMRLTIALSISVALIGGAMWFRFGQTTYTTSNIVAVETFEPALSEEAFLADFLATSTPVSTKTASAKPLSQEDLMGRQLFSDFIALKSQGQATPSNISALATQYAESIAGQSIQARQITSNQIIIVTDSEENLATYGNTVMSTRKKYQNLVSAEVNKGGLTSGKPLEIAQFINAVGKLYRSFGEELLLLKVPASLAENHVKLINNYFGSAEVMNIFTDISEDPTGVFVALKSQAENSTEEQVLILNIQTVLRVNGIILDSI